MNAIVYLNGEFKPLEKACISPYDRGFNFADGIYEVIRSYCGTLFQLQAHLERLSYSAHELMIPLINRDDIISAAQQLLADNQLQTGDALIYLQVTRGAVSRTHHIPSTEIEPTIFMSANPFKPHLDERQHGISVVLVPDTRWARCDIKTIGLLPNLLARNQATQAGAAEALFVRDDIILEGTHTNFFAVYRGQIITAPTGHRVLAGITRNLVLEMCRKEGIPIYENPIYANQLRHFDELFITSTTTEITPVVKVDDLVIKDGKVGEMTKRLQACQNRAMGLK